jgi:superfamily I DNA and/or RNA helicase
MKKTDKDLQLVIEQSILDLDKDEQLKSMYPNVIAFASNKAYLGQLIDKVKYLLYEQGMASIYDALGQIENTLFTEND